MRTGWIDRAVDAVFDGEIGASVSIVAPLAILGIFGAGIYGLQRKRVRVGVSNGPSNSAPVTSRKDPSILSTSDHMPPPSSSASDYGYLVLTVATADGGAIPDSARLEINRQVTMPGGEPRFELSLELAGGSHSYEISGVGPYEYVLDDVVVVANDVTRHTVELSRDAPTDTPADMPASDPVENDPSSPAHDPS
jgi:hypothetical protein